MGDVRKNGTADWLIVPVEQEPQVTVRIVVKILLAVTVRHKAEGRFCLRIRNDFFSGLLHNALSMLIDRKIIPSEFYFQTGLGSGDFGNQTVLIVCVYQQRTE